jgi:Zn-dependent peptidase ImmA (M78 family)
MGFTIQEQLALKKSLQYTFPDILRDKIEGMGILVLKQSAITKLGARGICLSASPLPVIVFGSESPGAQAFTLAHEFGHVLLGESGVSGQPRLGGKAGLKTIEDWCNRFAAAFLAPSTSIEGFLHKPETPAREIDRSVLKKISEIFAMSRHAMLIRLVSLGYVQPNFYWNTMRPVFLKEEEEYTSFGRSQYYAKRYVNSKGRFYTGLVMSAWSEGHIAAHHAAEYMGIKNFEHLREIREDYGF